MLITFLNWLIVSMINGLILLAIIALVVYWFYITDLPVVKESPTHDQFEPFLLSPVNRIILQYDLSL